MKIYIGKKRIFGIFDFGYSRTDTKIMQIWYKGINPYIKIWLRQAKNIKFWRYLTIVEGSGIINLSGKRYTMMEQVYMNRIQKLEAQPGYAKYSRQITLEKKIEAIKRKNPQE